MKRFIGLILCAAVLLTLMQPAAGASPAPNPRLRIGLSFGSGALVSANLDNHTGSGYEFGYLDADMQFIPVGSTAQSKITMVKNRNVYLSGGTYSDTPADTAIGAFHTPQGSYSSREEAEAITAGLREQGVPAFVSYSSGVWLVRSGSFTDSGGGARATGSNRCISVVVTGTTDILFQFDYGEAYHFCVRPIAPEGVEAQTWHQARRYYGMFEFRRHDGNNLSVFSVVNMQQYVKGVIPYEMSPSWPVEALKAQAVSARSYAASNLNRHRSDGFSICTTVHCQVYRGTAQASETSDRAVDETLGHYLTYNGQLCDTFYYSSNGGASENSENVWSTAIPYLRGIVDPYENPSQIPSYQWQFTFTNAQLSAYFNQNGRANSGVSNFYIDRYTAMGNVLSVTVLDSGGGTLAVYTKESARSLIRSLSGTGNALSQRYTITSGDAMLTAVSSGGRTMAHTDLGGLYAIDGSGNTVLLPPSGAVSLIDRAGLLYPLPTQSNPNTGVYTVSGRGHGHNVGMSQWGARGMADLGMTYEQILKHYFTGVEISYAG
ncbi:MAG: SpoIID/LytB domain-containing protein [Oscillospiraceae bacterium]|jgi:stage II sporulation protein D|nr:SpoIID/LytB domain-containing protein [Oscillospiraceae bacterium]